MLHEKEKKRKREMFLARDHHRKCTGHVFEAKKASIGTERVVKVILDLLAQNFSSRYFIILILSLFR